MDNSVQTDDLAVLSTEFRSPVALAGRRQLEPEGFAPKWQAPQVVDGRLRLRSLDAGKPRREGRVRAR